MAAFQLHLLGLLALKFVFSAKQRTVFPLTLRLDLDLVVCSFYLKVFRCLLDRLESLKCRELKLEIHTLQKRLQASLRECQKLRREVDCLRKKQRPKRPPQTQILDQEWSFEPLKYPEDWPRETRTSLRKTKNNPESARKKPPYPEKRPQKQLKTKPVPSNSRPVLPSFTKFLKSIDNFVK